MRCKMFLKPVHIEYSSHSDEHETTSLLHKECNFRINYIIDKIYSSITHKTTCNENDDANEVIEQIEFPRTFNSVFLLDNTNRSEYPKDINLKNQWRKPLLLEYHSCQKFWTLTAQILPDNPEKGVFID